jgi:CheY-like chemotaxis protein/HPt (histidine-containing phosphotransfer) domain-containing protein
MDGEIGIESEPGRGSTFWFTALYQKQPKADFPRLQEIPLNEANVLVVNCSKTSRQSLVQTLKTWGSEPLEAESLPEALSVLRSSITDQKPINLVLCDLDLPEMSGFDLAREMGKNETLRMIPMIIITAFGNPGDGKICRDLGIAGYLTKPISNNNLLRVIQTVIGLSQMGQKIDLVTKHSIVEKDRKEFRVLLVEDYPTNQEIALRHLQQEGYQVDLAEDGQQAVEIFKRKPYDLIFMDIQMPVMDGYQATRAIRELESSLASQEIEDDGDQKPKPGIPIIAMTAHAMKEHIALCLEAGMDDFLSKPLTKNALLAMAAKWVTLRPGSLDLDHSSTPSTITAHQEKEILTSRPFNLEKALSEFEGDKDFLSEVLEGFFKKATEQIGIIRQALIADDSETIRKEAHAIKGGAANLTAEVLSRAAFELEGKGKSGKLHGAAQLVDELQRKLEAFRSYWEKLPK